jgi:hypothetical protein
MVRTKNERRNKTMTFCKEVKLEYDLENETVKIKTNNIDYLDKLEKMYIKYPYIFSRVSGIGIHNEETYIIKIDYVRMIIPLTDEQLDLYTSIMEIKGE